MGLLARSEWFEAADGEYEQVQTGPLSWDSAELQNWDNDEEIRVEVMTQAGHEEQAEADKKYAKLAFNEKWFKIAVKKKMEWIEVVRLGRVHYSKNVTIKADIEVTPFNCREVTSSAAAAAKSIYFTECAVPSEASADAGSAPGEAVSMSSDEKEQAGACPDVLADLAKRCPKLEELHYVTGSGVYEVKEERFEEIAKHAPQLEQTLRHLRITGMISPALGKHLAFFKSLERLDISDCVNSGHSLDTCGYYSDEEERGLAYDDGLLTIYRANPRLAQLDLGYGDQSMTRYFWDYCVSQKCMDELQADGTLTVTMEDRYPLPHISGEPGGEGVDGNGDEADRRVQGMLRDLIFAHLALIHEGRAEGGDADNAELGWAKLEELAASIFEEQPRLGEAFKKKWNELLESGAIGDVLAGAVERKEQLSAALEALA